MSTMTSTEAVVFRPPSPRLGNFSKIFNDYIQRVSFTEPKIDVTELNARLDVIGRVDLAFDLAEAKQKKHPVASKDTANESIETSNLNESIESLQAQISQASAIKTVLRATRLSTPRKPSPRLTRAAIGLITGRIKEFKPSPPQEAVGDDAIQAMPENGFSLRTAGVTDARLASGSPETSDTVLRERSIFDQTPWDPASDTTPSTSPDAATFAQPMQASPTKKGHQMSQGDSTTYQYSTASINGVGAANINASSLTAQRNAAYARHLATNQPHGAAVSGSGTNYGARSTRPVPIMSSTGVFRYVPTGFRPSSGAEIYKVEVAMPGAVDRITPRYMSSREDKKLVLMGKLTTLLNMDRATEANVPTVTNSIHVFVDLSNITIGFYDCLKTSHKIPVAKRMKAPPFSFDHLAFVLERGRNVEKRVLAGSLVSTYTRKWPAFMQEAKDLGYEMNIMQRVSKPVVDPATKRSKKQSSGAEPEWTASSSDGEAAAAFAGQLKQGEQGVDEVLHLKMLQSGMDSRPGTVVLATGDAAEAEFSDGFKKNVERLLAQGWNVEVVGWSKGISKAWQEPEFLGRYGDRVRVIELDYFVEEIFGAWFGALGY